MPASFSDHGPGGDGSHFHWVSRAVLPHLPLPWLCIYLRHLPLPFLFLLPPRLRCSSSSPTIWTLCSPYCYPLIHSTPIPTSNSNSSSSSHTTRSTTSTRITTLGGSFSLPLDEEEDPSKALTSSHDSSSGPSDSYTPAKPGIASGFLSFASN